MENRKLNLSVDIGKIIISNPVMTASGTFGYAGEFNELVDLRRLGGIVVKGLALKPTKGNPPPRIVETASGMLNAIGLENIGIDAFIKDKIPLLKKLGTPVFANIYGTSIDEYVELATKIDSVSEIAGMEVNISCPNVKSGGIAFGVDPFMAHEVISAIRKNTLKPLMVKLSPNVTDIVEMALSVESAGADSISLINTLTGMAIDINSRRPILANVTGGLSGPAIKPVALRMVWQVAQKVKVPVIGIGGIMTAEDAIEFIIAGASAVQVGTANFINPAITMDILDGIEVYLKKQGIDNIKNLIGSLNL